MKSTRARSGLLALASALLVGCVGSSGPDIPDPSSGIGALTDMVASRFELPASTASLAVGGMLGVADNVLPADTWNAISRNIPGAEELLSLTRNDLPAGTSLKSLDDVGAMLGSGAGLDSSDLAEMGSAVEEYLAAAVDDETMRSQIRDIFG